MNRGIIVSRLGRFRGMPGTQASGAGKRSEWGGVMTAANLLDTLVQTGSQIDNRWWMYIVVHLGLFWFFFLVHRPLLLIERAVALFAYAAFDYINGNSLRSAYRFLGAMRGDLVAGFADELAKIPQTANILAASSISGRDDLIFVTHGVAFFVVAVFLIFRNVMIRRYERLFPGFAQKGG